MFIFAGFLIAFTFVAYSVWDLERKRDKVAGLVRRLEPLAKGESRTELRKIRRLCRSSFFSRTLANRLDDELADMERQKGVASTEERPSLPMFHRHLAALEERVANLEKLCSADA